MAIKPVEPFDCIVFGATGDLTLRKLLPALYNRFRDGQIPHDARIIGAARSDWTTPSFRAAPPTRCSTTWPSRTWTRRWPSASPPWCTTPRATPARRAGWTTSPTCWRAAGPRPRVLPRHLARPVRPDLPEPAGRRAGHGAEPRRAGEADRPRPASAREINDVVGQVFTEAQTFRIDHYLGKETVQNLLALRFANVVFERLWNADVIDHVQITVGETVGVEGRGDYYDHSGALRDMVQNHLMQLLCLLAMEPPTSLEADSVRDEKLKVLRSLKPIAPHEVGQVTVRGQYSPGRGGRPGGAGLPGRPRPRPHQPHRDLRGAEGRDPELALGRRAVLPAQRQAPAAEGQRDRGAVPQRPVQRVPARGAGDCRPTS